MESNQGRQTESTSSIGQWQYIDDVIRATEKAIDGAYWDGLDPTPLERELEGLKVAQSVGEQYVTDW